MRRAAALLGLWLAALGAAGLARAEVPVPPLSGRVVDLAGALAAPDREAITAKLAAFEQAKGSQVAVLIVPSLGGEAIEDFATRVTDQWKLGRAGVDDGVLLVVAMQERRMRIQTGRGVQGTLTDALSKRIIAERMTPLFRAGNLPGGIQAGVDAILTAVAGESLPAPGQAPARSPGADYTQMIVLALMLVPVVAFVLRDFVGRFVSGVFTGVATGGAVAFFTGKVPFGLIAGALAFFFAFAAESNTVKGARGRSRRDRDDWGFGSGGSGGGFSSSDSGGGFSGGGGGFDGGGASGSW